MVPGLVIWKGGTAEVIALLEAFDRNCTCRGMSGTCAAHQALLSQRFLDTLLFYRWMAERLLAEEFR